MPWAKVQPVLDPSVRDLCARRYPGHPRGCPNFGKRATCPPQALLLGDVLDLTRPVWAVWSVFDLATHVKKMRRRHPDWSWRQLINCLYWQGMARKQLRQVLEVFAERKDTLVQVDEHAGQVGKLALKAVMCPEAAGVNVTATMATIGELLEWPPKTKTYQVALVGTPRRVKR